MVIEKWIQSFLSFLTEIFQFQTFLFESVEIWMPFFFHFSIYTDFNLYI